MRMPPEFSVAMAARTISFVQVARLAQWVVVDDR